MSERRRKNPRPRRGFHDEEKALARGKSSNACLAALAMLVASKVGPVPRSGG